MNKYVNLQTNNSEPIYNIVYLPPDSVISLPSPALHAGILLLD